MSLKSESAVKFRKIKHKWKFDTPEELEQLETDYLKKKLLSKEPTIKGQVRITGGSVRNFMIDIPRNTRPLTDRMKVRIFDILREEIANKTILDLFAGSGSFGFEALSRGAKFVVFVDASKHAQRILTNNATKTGYVDKVEVIKEKVEEYLYKANKDVDKKSFEIIFLDPPYKIFNTKNTKTMTEILNMASNLLPGIQNKKTKQFKGAMIIKHPRRYPINEIKLENTKVVETYEFGLNAISLLIIDKYKE